ncbi:MAG: hypothetical protein IJ848_00225 [Alphaproteobacteria bacterium]|nr:hypothetical protein [Alphaproteobacteria bacterium]
MCSHTYASQNVVPPHPYEPRYIIFPGEKAHNSVQIMNYYQFNKYNMECFTKQMTREEQQNCKFCQYMKKQNEKQMSLVLGTQYECTTNNTPDREYHKINIEENQPLNYYINLLNILRQLNEKLNNEILSMAICQ